MLFFFFVVCFCCPFSSPFSRASIRTILSLFLPLPFPLLFSLLLYVPTTLLLQYFSQAPYSLRDARFGTKLGKDLVLEDTLWQGLADSHCNLAMGMTAENLADKYHVTRLESEEFALQSQNRYEAARAQGLFANEITPVHIKVREERRERCEYVCICVTERERKGERDSVCVCGRRSEKKAERDKIHGN